MSYDVTLSVSFDNGNDFDVFSNDSARENFDQLANTVTAAGLVICTFTLIVGGIGVMNIDNGFGAAMMAHRILQMPRS